MGDIEKAIKRLASWGDLPEIRALLMELLEAREELAELRRLRDRPLTMFGVWAHGGDDPVPSRVCLTDDGDGVDHQIDATPLLSEVLRRQAKRWCRSVSDGEGPALEQLLAQVPPERWLAVDCLANSRHVAWWRGPDNELLAHASGDDYQAAIRAATCKLLGLDAPVGGRQLSGSPADLIRAAIDWADAYSAGAPEEAFAKRALFESIEALRCTTAAELRQTCDSCQHWRRDDEPATEGGARPCGLDEEHDPAPRHPASLCARPGCHEALGVAKTDPAPDSAEFAAKLKWARAIVDEPTTPKSLRRTARKWLAKHAPGSGDPPLPKGVEIDGNLVRSEGDNDG